MLRPPARALDRGQPVGSGSHQAPGKGCIGERRDPAYTSVCPAGRGLLSLWWLANPWERLVFRRQIFIGLSGEPEVSASDGEALEGSSGSAVSLA